MVELYLGDCLTEMKKIPAGSVDMVLVDPPYGMTKNSWDTVIAFDDMWQCLRTVTKQNAAMVFFGFMPYASDLIQSNKKEFRYEWIWQKTMGVGFLNAKHMPLRVHESILVFYRSKPTYNPQMRTGFKPYKAVHNGKSKNYGAQHTTVNKSDGDRYPIDILTFSHDTNKVFPTQKPVALLEYLIKTYTNEGETVLDFTMGSGSTGVACLNTGRHFIGIEKNADIFELAKKRIEG